MNIDTESWILNQKGFSRETARAYEGLFTLGNGYLHTRGSLEEHLADAPQDSTYLRMPGNVTAENFGDSPAKWGTYVPGLFGPHPTLNAEAVNLPWFLELAPVVDGERLDLSRSRAKHLRTLHLRSATLSRDLTWTTQCGAILNLHFERFHAASRPGLSMQRLKVTADRDLTLTLHAGLDADVRTSGFDHLVETTFATEAGGHLCTVTTNGGDTCRLLSRLCLPAGTTVETAVDGRRLRATAELALEAGTEVTIEKRVAVATSIDRLPAPPEAVLDAAASLSYDALHQEHAQAWEARWQSCDVRIDGDAKTQEAMRTSLYHLLRVHVTGDPRVAVDAKGYAGDAYFGRFFWDTEMYLLPFYLYTDPERARTLTDFRLQSLGGARKNAAKYGYPGARYAWESDKDGVDGCSAWQYADHEIHVTADVVYGLEHYAAATADSDYLSVQAAETIVETARYWMARMDVRRGDAHPSLLGVMGPDEYTPISSNNAYTNWLVKRNLALAATIGASGGATSEEIEAFRQAAETLPVCRSPENPDLLLQCEEWLNFAEPDFEKQWPGRKGGYANAVSQERLYRTKCLKQADVVMLQTLFPNDFSDAECQAAWDEYVPYTTHDSSLSVGIHAIMALRLGLEAEAFRYFQKGLYKDLEVEKGGAEDGIHIAGCGCNWMVMVFGFAGMKSALQSDILTLSPHLPADWKSLSFPLVWKGVPVHIAITPSETCISNRGSTPITANVNGKQMTIAAGAAANWQSGSNGRE